MGRFSDAVVAIETEACSATGEDRQKLGRKARKVARILDSRRWTGMENPSDVEGYVYGEIGSILLFFFGKMTVSYLISVLWKQVFPESDWSAGAPAAS